MTNNIWEIHFSPSNGVRYYRIQGNQSQPHGEWKKEKTKEERGSRMRVRPVPSRKIQTKAEIKAIIARNPRWS